jgi:competence protein ComEA
VQISTGTGMMITMMLISRTASLMKIRTGGDRNGEANCFILIPIHWMRPAGKSLVLGIKPLAPLKIIWGLNEELASKLIPYIRIERKEYAAIEKPVYEKKVYTPAVVDVNSADTAAFIALPGIGSKLAQRIVNFRDKLGGFHTIEQVGETFGLPDSTFQKIKPRFVLSNPSVKKLNINMATVDELKMHPYIRYTIGNAIVQYRTQHGNFRSVNDLKKIVLITEDVYNKLQPYVKTE